jgi:predicted TIM-barrel fold metal-dependent hydrolase
MLHIGGGGRGLKPAFHNNGKAPTTDFLGGGENIRSKDYMVLAHSPETFLSCLVLDGVLERFPALRGGVIELGAMWVVPWLKRLDIAQDTFRRTEPSLSAPDLPLRASDYVHRQLWFTPFPTEPVGWMIEQAGDDLFLFSSDFPHPEGGRDPLGRFEASLAGVGDESKERFFSGNFAGMMGAIGAG